MPYAVYSECSGLCCDSFDNAMFPMRLAPFFPTGSPHPYAVSSVSPYGALWRELTALGLVRRSGAGCRLDYCIGQNRRLGRNKFGHGLMASMIGTE